MRGVLHLNHIILTCILLSKGVQMSIWIYTFGSGVAETDAELTNLDF